MAAVKVNGKHLTAILLVLCLGMFSIYLMTRALASRGSCAVVAYRPKSAMMEDPGSLSNDEFVKNYLTLSENARGIGPRGRFLNSFFHHHYFTEPPEFHARKNMLIAVITAEKYLLTRAVTIDRTWAQTMGGNNRLYFFVGEDCKTSHPVLQDMNIIKLKGIHDAIYPPQEKVFAVLKYIHKWFGEDFKWFVRADDDVYIRVEKLVAMLNGWEWTEKLELGHPGYGLEEDRERLKLLPHETYCMGGPGVVMSAPALKALSPHLGRCLQAVEHYNKGGASEAGWFNEDVELGRCMSRTVGIGCSPVAENPDRFFPDYNLEVLRYNNLRTMKKFHDAITIHPVKNPDTMLSVHHFYQTLKRQSLQADATRVVTELKSLCSLLASHHVHDFFTGNQATNCSKLLELQGNG